ncbi:histidine kinase [Haloferax sp. Atlit-12N]|uniref:DICT sensory domain-containing protein n=1 Tax=Haloferax sp. Atlit-12N TaxID=2077203 RepID=UPI000E26C71C|nr:DICT sensory domain-containing protein [Haloferax sp. Atlit-12N]RDZ63798.1 histidine kinase [Haloferax sp. Atlit-12N]
MGLDSFLGAIDAASRSLSVVNRSAPDPVQRMLETTFADQPVDVDELSNDTRGDDVVVLTEQTPEGREVVATSPLEVVMNTVLLVNSDLYKTGQANLAAFELPSVLTRLDDVPFSLRGYPESDKEKLLLVAISRYIERHAWRAGDGRLRSSFQRLSRIKDERGTRAVYQKVASTDVQTHVYGIPDWTPSSNSDLLTHGGYTEDFYDSWFVVYTPPEGGPVGAVESDGGTDEGTPSDERAIDGVSPGQPVALLALETEPKRWEGYWTFRPSLVADIDRYISRNM